MSHTSLMKILMAALLRGWHSTDQPLLTAVGAAGVSVLWGAWGNSFQAWWHVPFNLNIKEEELGRSL